MKGKRKPVELVVKEEIDEDEEDSDDKLSIETDVSSTEESEESDSESTPVLEVDTGNDSRHRGGRKKGQHYRSSYDTDTLKAAYNAVVEDGMAVYAASKKFRVPQSTLRDRVLGRISADVTSSGPPTIFTAEEEAGIASYVKLFSDIGHPLSRNKVRQIAGELAAQLQRRGFTDGKILSLRWYYKLIDRFPDMQSQKFANSKLQEIGYGYYKKLTEMFDECSLEDSPKRILNFDEVCVRTEGSTLTMICRNFSEENGNVSVVCNEDDKISVLGCFSANGKKVPPCFVFTNNGDSPSRKTISKIYPGAIVKYSATGERTNQILREYFELHFSQFVKTGASAKKHLIFYNSHYVSIPLSLWFWGEKNNVVFFPQPPHRMPKKEQIGLRQTVCLNGLHEMYEAELKVFRNKNPGVKLSCLDACKILCPLYSSLSGSHFEQAFKSAGIYPLPERNPGVLRFEKIVEDLKPESKLKKKRPKKKNVPPVPEATPPKKRRKAKSNPRGRVSKCLTLKKVGKMSEKMRRPVPVDWTAVIAQDENLEIISVPVTPRGDGGEKHGGEHTGSVRYGHTSQRMESLENGVTLESDTEESVQVEGETYQVYIQNAECGSDDPDLDTENMPVLVAEEVIIVNTVEC